jgi:hypothetical protein
MAKQAQNIWISIYIVLVPTHKRSAIGPGTYRPVYPLEHGHGRRTRSIWYMVLNFATFDLLFCEDGCVAVKAGVRHVFERK